jgi:hypothetical protein
MVARMNHRPDQRDLREEKEVVNHPLHTREQANISSFLRGLRAATTPTDLARELPRRNVVIPLRLDA